MSDLYTDSRGVITVCASCGKKNRVPFAKLDQVGKCASCGGELPQPESTIEIRNTDDFQQLITQAPVPVLVDFWAPWCGPCLAVAPQLEQVASQADGEYLIVKINTQALPDLGARYGVRAIPTMTLFKSGQEVKRTQGAMPAHQIDAFINT